MIKKGDMLLYNNSLEIVLSCNKQEDSHISFDFDISFDAIYLQNYSIEVSLLHIEYKECEHLTND